MTRLVILIATILLESTFALAQEQIGMRTSNYAGVNGLTLNPASSLTSPFQWDVNLLEFGQFFDNNYLFVENFRLLDALNLPNKGALRPDLEKNDLPTPTDRFVVDFYRSKNGTFRGDVLTHGLGPSLMLRLGDASVVSVYTRARFAFNARKVPGVLGYYEYSELPYEQPFEVEPFKLDFMAWSELGLSYANIAETEYGERSFGATIKILQGFEGAYAGLDQAMTFQQIRGNRLIGEPGSASYAFANPAVTDSVWQPQQQGGGVAVDLGLVYTILGDDDSYRWKIGFSLLDLGAVRFSKSAERHKVVVSDSTSINFTEFEQFNNIDDLDSIARVFSRQTMKDPNASLLGNAFSMWLPTALSGQVEFAVTPSLFLNATIVQGIPLAKNTIRRSSVAAFTPRFEKRWFEAALPISILNWKTMRSGLAVRLAFFWFGTEDLGSIFKKSDFDSTDFYFAVKVNPFKLNLHQSDKNRSGGRDRKQPKIKARGNANVKCPTF